MCIAVLRQTVLPIGVAICLTSAFWGLPALAQSNSSRAEFPGRRIGGGTRGECLAGRNPLVALNPVNNLGVTASDAPSLYFLMPELSEPRQVEFILRDNNENLVYETTLDVATTDEIVGVHLPQGQLNAAQDYHWYFSVICDPQDRSQNVVLTGWLRQVAPDISAPEPDAEFTLDQVLRYQESGLWTDAIAALVELRQTVPDDSEISAQWTRLLQHLELESVVESSFAARL